MSTRRRTLLTAFGTVLLGGIAGCTTGQDETTTTAPTATDATTTSETTRQRPTTTTVASGFSVVDVTFTDDEMTLSTDEHRPGRIRVDVNNRSLNDHHLYVVETDLDPGKLPRQPDGAVATSELRRILDLQVRHGSRLSETQPFDAGQYAFFCNEPGHYEAGEFAEFLIR